jgi:ppGpp synthetase/RelA/SpoT-type nucleotidyltranferase
MDKSEIKERYFKLQPLYERLGANTTQAIEGFLNSEKITYLNASYRIKEFKSFFEKIGRKQYINPFKETEDFCGIRIICYYNQDIQKIKKIIKEEFEIIKNEDKSSILKVSEFGYRSTHYIVKIKKEWLGAPNYRGLEDLKIEIQIRTILMHTWAEIEHKLNYKKEIEIPDEFIRKLYWLSAKFEEADYHFENLKHDIDNYRKKLQLEIEDDGAFQLHEKVNIDSLNVFLDHHFKNREEEPSYNDHLLLYHMHKLNVSFKDMINVITSLKDWTISIASDFKEIYLKDIGVKRRNIQGAELMLCLLDIYIPNFMEQRFKKEELVPSRVAIVRKWQKELHQKNNSILNQ